MRYCKGFKYQLKKQHIEHVKIYPKKTIKTSFITLTPEGILTIRAGYAWDGPSGPSIDTDSFMTASLVHDALYELFRKKLLNIKWRERADKELRRICIRSGMWRWRAWYVYKIVRRFAEKAATKPPREIHEVV